MNLDINTKVYNNINFNPFNFSEAFLKLQNETYNYPTSILSNNVFLIHKELINKNNSLLLIDKNLYKINELKYHTVPIQSLEEHDILVCKILSHQEPYIVGNFSKVHTDFEINLLNKEINICKNFVKYIFEHLNKRVSENNILTKQISIQIRFSKINESLQKIEHIFKLDDEQFKKHSRIMISELIQEITFELTRLSGGRGFLKGNVCELLFVFEIINKLYFNNMESL